MTDANDIALKRLARQESVAERLDEAAQRIATELATELLADPQQLFALYTEHEPNIWPRLARIMASIGEYVTSAHVGDCAMAKIDAMIHAKALRAELMTVARRHVIERAEELAREEQWRGGYDG